MNFAIKSFPRWVAFVGLLLMASEAFAQTSPGALNWSDVSDMLFSMREAGYAMSGYFWDEADSLAGAFTYIMVAYTLMMVAMGVYEGDWRSEILGKVGIWLVVALVMLNSWSDTARSAHPSLRVPDWSVKSLMVDSFDQLRDKLVVDGIGNTGVGTATTTDSGVVMAVKLIVKAQSDIADGFLERSKIREASVANITNPVSKLGAAVGMAVDSLYSGLLEIIVTVLFFALIVTFFLTVFYGDLLSMAGMFVGMLMVPTIIFPPLKWLWEGWLKFMIQSGFYKLIAGFFLILTLKTVTQIQGQATMILNTSLANPSAATASTVAVLDIMTLALTIIYLCAAIWMMWRTHVITEMLMSGSVGKGLSGMGAGFKLT